MKDSLKAFPVIPILDIEDMSKKPDDEIKVFRDRIRKGGVFMSIPEKEKAMISVILDLLRLCHMKLPKNDVRYMTASRKIFQAINELEEKTDYQEWGWKKETTAAQVSKEGS